MSQTTAMTPESPPTVQQLLAFYLEAGVDCALTDEPVNRLSDPDLMPAAREAAPAQPASGPLPAAAATTPVRARRTGGAGGRHPVGAGSRAHRAVARRAAGAAGEVRRLRAEVHRHAAGVRRRQPAGARHVRRRGAGPRRGPRGPALRRPLRQIARPHAGGDRARPHQRLYRQCRALAAARQPHADAAGDRKSACRSSSARSSWSIRTCW